MRELLLAHNKKKMETIAKTKMVLERDLAQQQSASDAIGQTFIDNQLRCKMTDNRLPSFVEWVDGLFKNTWVNHYSTFNPNTPLLPDESMVQIYTQLEAEFPFHYGSIRSLLFGSQSHQLARASDVYIFRKQLKVVHFFLSMIRERDKHHLIHWAMISTIALHFWGVDDKCYRKTLARSSSADVHVALCKLDELYMGSEEAHMAVVQSQIVSVGVVILVIIV